MMEQDHIQPEDFKDRTIFMSSTTTSIGARKAMKKFVKAIPQMLSNFPENFLKDIGHFSYLDLKKMVCYRSPMNQTVCGTLSPTKC